MLIFSVLQLSIGFFFAWLLVIRYLCKFRGGMLSAVGQILLTMSMVVGSFYFYFLLVIIWPTIPWRTPIRTILFSGLTLVIVWRYILFERLVRSIQLERKNGRILKEVKSDS